MNANVLSSQVALTYLPRSKTEQFSAKYHSELHILVGRDPSRSPQSVALMVLFGVSCPKPARFEARQA